MFSIAPIAARTVALGPLGISLDRSAGRSPDSATRRPEATRAVAVVRPFQHAGAIADVFKTVRQLSRLALPPQRRGSESVDSRPHTHHSRNVTRHLSAEKALSQLPTGANGHDAHDLRDGVNTLAGRDNLSHHRRNS